MSWFPYETVAGHHLTPRVSGTVSQGSQTSGPIKFIVDTGAVMTLVPRFVIGGLFGDLNRYEERPLGAKGADDKNLYGIPLDLEISIRGVPELSAIRERVWIYRGPWALLGQTWLEKVGARFENFPANPRGRRFALYPCPWPRK